MSVEFAAKIRGTVYPKTGIPIRERDVVNAEFDSPVACRVAIRKKRGSRFGIVQRRAVLADIRSVEQDVTCFLRRNARNPFDALLVRPFHLLKKSYAVASAVSLLIDLSVATMTDQH